MGDEVELLDRVERLKTVMLARATGEGASESEYRELRAELIANPSIKDRLPPCVRKYRTLAEFWGFIQPEFRAYAQRRAYLVEEFDPVLRWLERGAVSPVEEQDDAIFEHIDAPHLRATWRRAFDRVRTGDTDGAITAARTLVETACKHILKDLSVTYPENVDLPKLYRLTAEQLRLAPNQQTEPIFRQILGGCTAAVEGLGAVRNKLGDAHGKGEDSATPDTRHAELAVNLAGSVTAFLIATWQAQGTGNDR